MGEVAYAVLGPLRVTRDGAVVEIDGKRRQVLLSLLLARGRRVPVDVIVDDVWGLAPPASARHAVEVYVSALRGALGADSIRHRDGGYEVSLGGGALDVDDFEELADAGAAALRQGAYGAAREALQSALKLFRGPPFADLPESERARAEGHRLDEVLRRVRLDRIDADLALGRHDVLVAELTRLAAQEPTDEETIRRLMLALYRCGRQPEALAVARVLRAQLDSRLGLEPTRELADLERAILRQEPILDLPARDEERTLPVAPTTFVGRSREMAELIALFDRPGVRLLTLTGAGGTGKTRLALHVAEQLRDATPVHWVSLAPLAEGALVTQTVAHTIGAAQVPTESSADALSRALDDRPRILVLDNAEHVLDAVAELAAHLVESCDGLRILVTSRERLRVAAEHEVPVGVLDLGDAVALLVERAGAAGIVLEESAEVEDLAVALDALPLAIELAVPRLRAFSVRELVERLDERLTLLEGPRDAEPRHRSLRATLAWSYELLDPGSRHALASLAVFAGSFTLDAADRVCDTDARTVQTLVEKSLVVRRFAEGGTRFFMLEAVRAFAAEQLDGNGRGPILGDRLADWALEVALTADPHLRGPAQLVWMAQLDEEIHNLRAALEHLIEAGNGDRALALVDALAWYLSRRGSSAELRRALERALVLPSEDAKARCRALVRLAPFDGKQTYAIAREAVELAERVGEPVLAGQAIELLAFEPDLDLSRAIALLDEADERFFEAGALDDRARVRIHRAWVFLQHDRPDRALDATTDAFALLRRLGNRHGEAVNHVARAAALLRLERVDEAAGDLRQAIDLFLLVGQADLQYGFGFAVGAAILAVRGEADDAAVMLGVVDGIVRSTRMSPGDFEERLQGDVHARLRLALGARVLEARMSDGRGLEPTTAAERLFEKLDRSGDGTD